MDPAEVMSATCQLFSIPPFGAKVDLPSGSLAIGRNHGTTFGQGDLSRKDRPHRNMRSWFFNGTQTQDHVELAHGRTADLSGHEVRQTEI